MHTPSLLAFHFFYFSLKFSNWINAVQALMWLTSVPKTWLAVMIP